MGGFDDEANHGLLRENLPAVRWVGGPDIELISMATGAKIVPMFSQLTAEKLGTCKSVRMIGNQDGDSNNSLVFEGCPHSNVVTVTLHSSNDQLVNEVDRSFHDAVCVARNIMFDSRIVYGGTSCELRAAEYLESTAFAESKFAPKFIQGKGAEMAVCRRAFAEALLDIPRVLAENSVASVSEDVLEFVSEIQSKIRATSNSEWIGVDAMGSGQENMKKANVIEGLRQKCQQILLANDLAQMIIKIDSIRIVSLDE